MGKLTQPCSECGARPWDPHKEGCPNLLRMEGLRTMVDQVGTLHGIAEPEERISREELYFEICNALRKRSTCKRGKVGCILVKDKRIIANGYNGSPPGMPHCFELGCDVDENHHVGGCRRAIHAEANVIAWAARHGVATEDSVLYGTHSPCLKCAQLLVSAGIMAVHYQTPYRLPEGLDLLDRANVVCVHHG